jgi:hypothetical protein
MKKNVVTVFLARRAFIYTLRGLASIEALK